MTFEEREKLTNEFLDKCKEVLSCKGKDYTINNEAFGDLNETAVEIGVTLEQALWVYAKKHLSAIKNFIHRGKVESEPIEMRLVDMANYMALLYAIVKEKENAQ